MNRLDPEACMTIKTLAARGATNSHIACPENEVIQLGAASVTILLGESLRAFTMTLAGTRDAADALVQDTLLRALQKHDRFEPGAHLLAWLFTTPCNRFSSDYGSRRREVEDVDGLCVATLSTAPEQPECVAFGPSRDCPRSGAAQAGD